jgi:hypothetical protein
LRLRPRQAPCHAFSSSSHALGMKGCTSVGETP